MSDHQTNEAKKKTSKLPMIIVGIFVIVGIAVVAKNAMSPAKNTAIAVVNIPDFSELAKTGELAFGKNCQACHGSNAAGSNQGPPLVHTTYNPGHHSDAAFFLAAKRGVQSHHWRFGNMPPQPQASEDDLKAIVQYVRELQQANGIFYKKHTM